jgi:hypothetical protein
MMMGALRVNSKVQREVTKLRNHRGLLLEERSGQLAHRHRRIRQRGGGCTVHASGFPLFNDEVFTGSLGGWCGSGLLLGEGGDAVRRAIASVRLGRQWRLTACLAWCGGKEEERRAHGPAGAGDKGLKRMTGGSRYSADFYF